MNNSSTKNAIVAIHDIILTKKGRFSIVSLIEFATLYKSDLFFNVMLDEFQDFINHMVYDPDFAKTIRKIEYNSV